MELIQWWKPIQRWKETTITKGKTMEVITMTTMTIIGKKQTKNDNKKPFSYNQTKHNDNGDGVGKMVMVLEQSIM